MIPNMFLDNNRRDFSKIVAHARDYMGQAFSIGDYKSLVPYKHIESRGLFVRDTRLHYTYNGDRLYEVSVYMPTESDWLKMWENGTPHFNHNRWGYPDASFSVAWNWQKKWRPKHFKGTAYEWFAGYFPNHDIPRSIARRLR